MNGLMLAFAFVLPYHVMRTAAAAGLRVHVLGSGPSRGLRASRHCASYRRSALQWDGPHDADLLLAEIEDFVRRRRIDIVFPSDDVSTRLLARLADRLPVRSTPLPQVPTFDLLNDKWNFTRFALARGVRVPQGWCYDSPDALRRDLLAGAPALPVTVKPTNQSGSRGVMHIREAGEIGLLDAVDYRPILVQRHIVGETIGISVVCRDGRILAHATQRRDEHRFELFANADLVDNVARLVAATGFTGPANFDAVLERQSGLAYIVECNPRFWFTINLSMIAGLNFLRHAFLPPGPVSSEPATRAEGAVCLSLKKIVAAPWRAGALDRAFAAYCLGDPLVYLLQRRGYFDDTEVAVDAAQMQSYDLAAPGAALPVTA